MTIQIRDPKWFQSTITGDYYDPIKAASTYEGRIIQTFPRQLPKGVEEKQVIAEAETAGNSVTALVLI